MNEIFEGERLENNDIKSEHANGIIYINSQGINYDLYLFLF